MNLRALVDQQTMDSTWQGGYDPGDESGDESVSSVVEREDRPVDVVQTAEGEGGGTGETVETTDTAAEATPSDEAAAADADHSQAADPLSEVPDGADWVLLDEPYEGTDLRVYEVRGDWTQEQLAEAAFKAFLPECMVVLRKPQVRAGKTFERAMDYHWNCKTMKRITSANKDAFARERLGRSA